MGFLLFVLIAVFVLILASGGYVFFAACRKRNTNWLDEAAVSKTNNAQYYPFMVATDQWLRDHNAQSVCTFAADGVQLCGLWIPAKDSHGTVLMAHGYRSTMLLDFHLPFKLFHRLGMDILVPYQRTHGKSGGNYITFGAKESVDMQRWIRYHNDHLSRKPMILYGISMGASTMLYLADRILPDNVEGIIADCGFTSPKEIIENVYRRVLRLPPLGSVHVAGFFARIFAGIRFSENDTRKSLANARLPVLLIHGSDDSFVPCDMSLQAYEMCTSKKKLLIVEGAEHGLSLLTDGFAYTTHVIDFIKDCFPGFSISEDALD